VANNLGQSLDGVNIFNAVLKGPTVSSVRKCAGSWFHAFGPATVNAREPKCEAEELTIAEF